MSRLPITLAVLPIVLAGFTGIPATPGHAEMSAATLYRDGVAARKAGDFRTAERDLQAALRLEPRNADVLLELGLVYVATRRYDEARTELHRALQIAPNYVDVRLSLARLDAYTGDYAAAQTIVDQVLVQYPSDEEALVLAGRIAYYRNDLAAAQQRFEAALAQAPNDADALMGLGDVRAAAGDDVGARSLYERALALAPHSDELRQRVTRPVRQRYRWRFDSAFAYSLLSRQPQKDWKELFNQLSYQLSDATTIHGRVDESERFSQYDTYIEAGVDRRFSDSVGAYFYAGGTPVAHFRERITGMGGGTLRLARGGSAVGATVATLDGKVADYVSGDVETIKPGIQQYFLGGILWVAGQSITTRDENGRFLQGWLAKVGGDLTDRLRLYVGVASAPETSENVTAETRSAFGGAIYDLTDRIALRLDYAHDDRRRSYIRNAFALGISVRF